jgi:hypothetical protein
MKDPTRPGLVLRLEALAVLALALFLYRELGVSWWLFAGLFLVPDLALLVYLVDRRVATVVYNLAHAYVWPAGLFAAGFVAGRAPLMGIALIWAAHIGFDRLLGFGLKYPDGFRETHLQRVFD